MRPSANPRREAMSDSTEEQSPHELTYAVIRRPNAHWLSLVIAVIVPVILPFFWAIEFVEEPPGGNGYVLDDETRLLVAIVGGILAASWLFAVVKLHNAWRRYRKTGAVLR